VFRADEHPVKFRCQVRTSPPRCAYIFLAMVQNPFLLVLERLHAEFSALGAGAPAAYIPELAKANPAHFGIAVATVDGVAYCVGDATVPFTIQSISKPLVYGLALDDHGAELVDSKVGVEPSGEAFNAISLEPGSGRPRNPMINAGAIAMSSLIAGRSPDEKFARTLAMLSRYAGRALDVDEAVFRSEQETGHRNRAIGHLLRNAGIIEGDVDPVCDRYFRQCSVRVTCEDLAFMAATLANEGLNPRTGERAVSRENVERILSVMSACGMYDFAGAWGYRVGMPAKSGVGGGIMAVLPGQFGIGIFAPPLDSLGNSVRGVAVCEAMSREFGLHLHRPPLNVGSVVRAAHTLAGKRSKHRRTQEEASRLDAAASSVRILEAQGAVALSTAEVLIRAALDGAPAGGTIIIDFRRVTTVDSSVASLFGSLAAELKCHETTLAISGIDEGTAWAPAFHEALRQAGTVCPPCYVDLDTALEACEDGLLGSDGSSVVSLSAANHPVARALPPEDQSALLRLGVLQSYAANTRIISQGGPPDTVYLALSGLAAVSVSAPSGTQHRLATLGPGTTFGELALMDRGPRSADVYAETAVTCLAVPVDALREEPGLQALRLHLIEVLAQDLADRLRRANAEIQALAE
jgi:glutaminase